MFTGIVQAVGEVASVSDRGGRRRLLVSSQGWAHRPGPGDSIAVSGCCLTISEPPEEAGGLAFDVVPETLAKTTLGGVRAGDRVNLEHAARADSLLDGHVVQGHVDAAAEVVLVSPGEDWRVRLRPPAGLMPYVTPKGSVCLDGVSLTVAGLEPRAGWFEVALIPVTLARTTLGSLAPGGRVNLECDPLAKTVVHYLRHYTGGALPLGVGPGPA
ncbi:MAG: riboflavin synthase [Phycisphaeraceae bacterium]|nr:MAG: riboflavin synthase [Phycisphaeraceae bacterium]